MKRKTRILVVDDESIVRESLQDWLEGVGYDVVTAGSGEEALRIIRRARIRIMLADLVMPGMDGKETVKKIRRNPETKDLAVAFLTVSVASGFAAKTLKELGVIDYISKPFENEELIERINKLLGTLKK